MSIQYDAVVTTSVAKQIAEQLREAILRGDLKVDARLPTETELAERFNVSRPTIREALKRLAAQHLIRSRRGPTGGTFVNRPSEADMRDALTTASTLLVSLGAFDFEDIASARHHLERLCCQLAVKMRKNKHLKTMAEEISEQQRAELSDEDFCASDVRFHRALVDAAGNPMLGFMMFSVIEALQPVENLLIFRFRDRAQVVRQHQQIYQAVLAQDEIAALAALDEQMQDLSDQYLQAKQWRQQREANLAASHS